MIKYRIGHVTDYGVNPAYDPDAGRNRLAEQEQRNRAIEARRLQAVDAIRTYRILSLSRTPASMVMWAHYASNSQGLCIGIDWSKANLIATGTAVGRQAGKPVALAVEYKDHPFESRFERHEDHVLYALGRKHSDWAYEREVRILRHSSAFAEYAPGTNNKVGLLPIPADSISDIVLGANPDRSIRLMVADQLKHFPTAKLSQLQLNASGYSSRLRVLPDASSLA